MRAVIVGGGIGGLAAAVALRKVGVETQVVEQVAGIREVGAGLSLWPNAMIALRELGLEDKVAASGSAVEQISSRTQAGRLISVTDIAELSREAVAPCICIHRAELQRILFEALPPDSVRTGARCVGFDDSTAILESGERIEADLLVGADGISSVLRNKLHGEEQPRYAGYTCWRGICRNDGVLRDGQALLVLGAGSQFGAWRCGEGRLYWFLTRNAAQGNALTKADAMAVVRDWAVPVPPVVEGTPEDAILQNDIVDRQPLRSWGRGRVTLLGDAAHAMTPNLGQGACQALEDGVTLANSVHSHATTEEALRAYERLRIPRTTAIVNDSWRTGLALQTDQAALASLRNWLSATRIGRSLEKRMFRKLLLYRLPKL
jgi:2-polyprenyl-6-methoxyphenol hydroxylase-like FAD-dependent oxidoreductase